MYLHTELLINQIAQDEPDPAAANALQEDLGGQFGEMRTMMQYLFQAINFRGPQGKPYKDLMQGIGTEEISHVELIGTTIARLLDGSPRYNGKATDPLDKAGSGGASPEQVVLLRDADGDGHAAGEQAGELPIPRRGVGLGVGGVGHVVITFVRGRPPRVVMPAPVIWSMTSVRSAWLVHTMRVGASAPSRSRCISRSRRAIRCAPRSSRLPRAASA